MRAATAATLVLALPPSVGQAQETAAAVSAYAPATDLSASAATRDPSLIESEQALKGTELDKLRKDMELSADRQAEIAAEIAGLSKDQQTLTDQLMTTAAKVQTLEQSISESEERLARNSANEATIRASLVSRRAVLIEVLATAQRIGRRPPPALVVSPDDALKAVRSAIILGAVLPEIRTEAEALEGNLSALVSVRQQAEAERDRLKASAIAIAEEHQRLALLSEEKKKLAESRRTDLEAERAKAESLAANARTLEELIAGLDRQLKAARRAQGLDGLQAGETPQKPDQTGRLQPAMPFAEARGKLLMPVRGVAIQSYGDDNGLGGLSQGISVATRAGAQVTAPADGRVVYAGPFRAYGQLLILDAGDGYHVVLAGMERLDVNLDQFVLTGEPVGVMGNQRLASATAPDASLAQPVLYVEFRKDGTSIDPSPWWVASQDRKVGG
ncbi:murein hydrolase activator EnvC family protein [Oryzibacter oryziterrae]|uniref:murein hydrolase activator EnvC family protein n=1 Tax=Oryzibacter oryziterrae TaxID=2766474 RepID=UPI001F23BF92|nr:peptidoglycan DD-metalloendopeptidase family protein [Oryzibacter oryziterrae]